MSHKRRVWFMITQSLLLFAIIALLGYGLVRKGPLSAEPILTAGWVIATALAILTTWQSKQTLSEPRGPRLMRRSPPMNAETIMHLILSPEDCDDLVNTLDEVYHKKKARIGVKRADIWYWKATLGLTWRQLFRGRTKAAIVKLVCWFLRLFGLSNMADLLARAANEVASAPPLQLRRKGPK
jgi:hypothetical protein